MESPLSFFRSWYDEAQKAKLPSADSMVLVTATPDAIPSARVVLLRGLEEGQFRFFTNYDSRKSKEMDANPRAQLLFFWPELGRQIRVEGEVSRLPAAASDEYWATRPRESRIGAIASQQSRPLSSMDELKARVKEVEAQHSGKEVLRPENWGGFGLTPTRFEFWQEGEFRLHERLVFERSSGDSWSRGRLFP